jgi:hypothetical protein
MEQQSPSSPMRLLEILKDRFGALEAANSSIQLARYAPEEALAMDRLVAESVLEFGSSLREARDGAMQWARARGWHRLREGCTAAAGRITLRLPRCLSSGLTTQGSVVRGRRERLSSARKHARPRIRCSRLLNNGLQGRLRGLQSIFTLGARRPARHWTSKSLPLGVARDVNVRRELDFRAPVEVLAPFRSDLHQVSDSLDQIK